MSPELRRAESPAAPPEGEPLAGLLPACELEVKLWVALRGLGYRER